MTTMCQPVQRSPSPKGVQWLPQQSPYPPPFPARSPERNAHEQISHPLAGWGYGSRTDARPDHPLRDDPHPRHLAGCYLHHSVCAGWDSRTRVRRPRQVDYTCKVKTSVRIQALLVVAVSLGTLLAACSDRYRNPCDDPNNETAACQTAPQP